MSKKKRNNPFYQSIDSLIKGMKKRGMSQERIDSELNRMIDELKISEIEKSLIKSMLGLISSISLEDAYFQVLEEMETNRACVSTSTHEVEETEKQLKSIKSQKEKLKEEMERIKAEISDLDAQAQELGKKMESHKKAEEGYLTTRDKLQSQASELEKGVTAIIDASASFATLNRHSMHYIVTTEREAIEAPILRMVANIESPYFVDESFIQYLHDNLSQSELIHIDRIIKMLAVIVEVYESGVNYIIDVSSEMEENIKPFLNTKGIPMQRELTKS